MSKIPENYVVNKLYSYAHEPVYRRHDNTYNAGCPVCKEGKSLGKKKRLFYYPTSNTFHCFNCSKTWSAYSWILSVCNITKEEMDEEIQQNSSSVDVLKKINLPILKNKNIPDLPYDSINVFDEIQQSYFTKYKDFYNVLQYVVQRKLHTAINKSPNLFTSLTDKVHKGRLCIPFYDRNNKVLFYQSRSVNGSEPRYMGKYGSDKTIFGIERVDPNIPYIFMFEGPIDAMFVKNGVGLAGLTLGEKQRNQLNEFPFHKKIWVLDNPKFDETASNKIKELVKAGNMVFRWPLGMSHKDFNEMAIADEIDEIPYKVITENIY